MKNIRLLITVIFSVVVLSACGGGGTDIANNQGSPTMRPLANPITPSGKLIIDSGRGTINNQDTEQLEKPGL